MADKINGYGRLGLDVGPAKSRSVASKTSEQAPGGAARSGEARDAVEITDTATRLKVIEARLAKLPDVDRGRVDAVRERIESGDYRPDAKRIAEKLMRLEQQLA